MKKLVVGALIYTLCTLAVPAMAQVTATLSANPASIVLGQSSTLTWSSANASSCTGTGFSTGNAVSGSVTVTPTANASYSVACTGSGSGNASVAVVSGPTGWWSFDSGTINGTTVTDVSGSGFPGTLLGSYSFVGGAIGQAFNGNGSNSAVTLLQPTPLSFRGQRDAFTLSAWINTTAASSGCIVCKGDDVSWPYELYVSQGHLGAGVGDVFSTGTTTVNDGTWHHVAMTAPAANSGLKLYVDGVLQSFGSGTGGIGNTTNTKDILIGARRAASNSDLAVVFNGAIDEVRMYPRALSASEIQALFNARSPSTTMLLGLFGGQCDWAGCTFFHNDYGRYPDYTENRSYMGPSGGSSPSQEDLGYPFIAGISTVDNVGDSTGTKCGGYADMAAAARGDYDGLYQYAINNGLLGGAGRPYAIRINWEWDGKWPCVSPWPYESCCGWDENHPKWTPAIWIGAFRRVVGLIRATPGLENVKIEWDGPTDAIQATYYPGDDVVDLIGFDVYWNNQWDGPDQLGSWNKHLDEINAKSAFAAAHNKPMIVGEWCDTYGGESITRFAAWMKANNVVANAYWNTDYGIGATNGCYLGNVPSRKAAYLAAFGGTTYSGSYWPTPLLSLPAGNPMNY